jgi:hypothetical protein
MAKLTFKNDNDQQTPESTSALHNGAAKDDQVTLSADNTFSLADLLVNDPGSAIYCEIEGTTKVTGGDGQIIYDSESMTFEVVGNVTSFEYMIRLANGTYSMATVTVDAYVPPCEPHVGDSLFLEDFSSYVASGPYGTFNLATTGWVGGGSAEVVMDGYLGVLTGPDADSSWLDTQGSPGGLDLTHAVTDDGGGKAQISLMVAVQQHSNLTTTGELQIYWNNTLVQTITTASLGDVNTFHEVSVLVDSISGVDANTLEIKDTGVGFVGFAVDSVSVNDWILC